MPCLPITAPSCEFPPDCTGSGCALPNLQLSANGSDAAGWWTATGPTNDITLRASLDQDTSGPCDAPGAGNPIPLSTIGSYLSLNNGINSSANRGAFGLVRCLAAVSGDSNTLPQGCSIDSDGNIVPGQRGRMFTIPIFDSGSSTCTGNFTQSSPVVGYATVRIDAVAGAVGGDNPTSVPVINMTTVANKTPTGVASGGGCFGTDCSVLSTP